MINLTLRIILISGSLITLLYMLIRIRISRLQIKDSIYWILFLLSLLIFSIFPSIAIWFSHILKIQSPINFMLLFVVFLLIIQLFLVSMRLGKLDSSLKALTQRIAIDEKNKRDSLLDNEKTKSDTT